MLNVKEIVERAFDALVEKHIGFDKLAAKIARKGKVANPDAVAAAIGFKKFGKKEMIRRAVAARKRK